MDLLKAARIFACIILIVGAVLIGLISYRVGESDYYRGWEDMVQKLGSGDSASSYTHRSSEHFILGLIAGSILLAPVVLSIYNKIRREYIEQRKLERMHPGNIWIMVNTGIAIGFFCGALHSLSNDSWGNSGFGGLLLFLLLIFYIYVLPTAGMIGYFFMSEPSLYTGSIIISMISTYSLFIMGYLHHRYFLKRQRSLIQEFIEHCSRGSELPINDIALVFLLNPVQVRTHLLKLKKKGMIQCTIENWKVKDTGGPDTRGELLTHTNVGRSRSIEFMGSQEDMWSKLYTKFEDSDLSGEAEFCVRCGSPLIGEIHCPLCGYRNLYSFYDSTSAKLSQLTGWLSSRRGGIDPLQNALIAMVVSCVGLSLLLGAFCYQTASVAERSYYNLRFEFLLGIIGGAAISPFIFIPVYLKVRREIMEQKILPYERRMISQIHVHILIGVVIISIALIDIFLIDKSSGPGEIILGVVIIFYLSVATGGISSLYFINYWGSQGTGLVWVGIIPLIATYYFYCGYIYRAREWRKMHSEYDARGMGKRKMERIIKYLASFQPGNDIPLHLTGRMVNMEPNRVRPLLVKMIRKRYIYGSVSEFHIEFNGIHAVDEGKFVVDDGYLYDNAE